MKKKIIGSIFLSILSFSSFAHAYSLDNHKHEQHLDSKKNEDSKLEYNCPMHPEVKGKEGDECPKCGMFLEKISKDEIIENIK